MDHTNVASIKIFKNEKNLSFYQEEKYVVIFQEPNSDVFSSLHMI